MRTDLPYPNADCEKTQGPPTLYEQDVRAKLEAEAKYAGCCAEPQRQMTDSEKLTELFRYHPPTSDTLPKYAAINQAAKNFAEVILQNCPRSADRSAAIRLIRDARMTANAAVALNGLSL